MALPPDLLQAVSTQGGGKIALVLGAGCSVEAPTCVPVSSVCSAEVHRLLVADGVLQNGECANPADLSIVADAVFAKTSLQRPVVERLRAQYDLKLATANDGYRIAAAMLCEGVITSVVTLNFDLALTHALSDIGASQIVGVIERPEDLSVQRAVNVFYLHRNVNADPELWVLRTAALEDEWEDHWEPIITARVLTTPVVVFAGLGTPVAVLIASTKLIRAALPPVTQLYQVDPADKTQSQFFQELAIDSSAYIRSGWCQFMEALSQRLMQEHSVKLEQAIAQKVQDDHLPVENIVNLLTRLQSFGLLKVGRIRADWLLHDKRYHPVNPNTLGLIADLVLAIAMIARCSGADAIIVDDGIVEFHREGRAVAAFLVASGSGHRGKSAIEAHVQSRRGQYRGRPVPPCGVIVGGTSDAWTTVVTPPTDVVLGDMSGDITVGSTVLPLRYISELRANPNGIQQLVP